MNGVIAVVAYRPKRGKDKELLDLVCARVPTLRKEGLVTESNSQLSTLNHGAAKSPIDLPASTITTKSEPLDRNRGIKLPSNCGRPRDLS
jgi:hypothetical protein